MLARAQCAVCNCIAGLTHAPVAVRIELVNETPTIHPEATTGRPTPTELEFYCVDCGTSPCSHGVTAAEIGYAQLVSTLHAQVDEYVTRVRWLAVSNLVLLVALIACVIALAS